MSTTLESIARAVPDRQPAWGIALLFPDQGTWSEDEYLDLPGNHLIEFNEGHLEVLPMPTPYHQMIAFHLHRTLHDYVKARQLGAVFSAPLPVRVGPAKYREPDVVFVSTSQLPADIRRVKQLDRADLVVEVVSEGAENRTRDFVEKRAVYAQAGIAEYWIVEPNSAEVSVLVLKNGQYEIDAVYRPGECLRSVLFPDFEMSVDSVFSVE
ncbi:MAG: Uma2 family endonuclease [Planctomycetia bacterium]|nr:Uma2 family endonuclease [Planctomycetia bacterium]